MINEKSLNTGAISINYAEDSSSGSPLVFLHGISGWWQSWIPVMPALSMRWHIYALDFRGHGQSDRVANGYHWDNYVQDTISFLKERVGEPAILVAHSMGAMVTLKIASQVPESVRAIVLEDPPLSICRGSPRRKKPKHDVFVAWRDLGRTEYTLERWLPVLAEISPDDDDITLRIRAKTLSMLDPEVLTQAIDGTATENFIAETDVEQITCPSLLLRGDPALGGVIDDEEIEWLKSILPRSLVVSVPGVGHNIHTQKPEAFSRAVAMFLEISQAPS
jgi:pimeloyl-ACP methyl ester carboxylesterase